MEITMTKDFYQTFLKINKYWVLLIILFFVFYTVIMRQAINKIIPDGAGQHFVLQRAFTAERIINIIEDWKQPGIVLEDTINRYIEWIIIYDYIYPLVYAVFGATLLAKLLNYLSPDFTRGKLVLLLLPFIAGLLDVIENTVHVIVLQGPSPLETLPTTLIQFTSLAAHVKLVLLTLTISGISALALLFLVLRRAYSKKK